MIGAMQGMFDFLTPQEPVKRNPLEEMLRSYQAPQRPKMDAYGELLQRFPQRQDYQMGTGGKIGSALVAGLAGLTAPSGAHAANFAFDLKDRPFRQAIEDYAFETKAAKDAAEIESEYISDREKVWDQMFEMQDKIQDNDRLEKDASTRHWRAKTMEEYLRDKTKRDNRAAEERAKNDAIRAAAAKEQAAAATTRAGAAASRAKHLNAKPTGTTRPPSESQKWIAEKRAMDYVRATRPELAKFVGTDMYQNIIGFNQEEAEKDPAGFQAFMSAIEQVRDMRLGIDDDDEDAEFNAILEDDGVTP